MLRVLRVLSDWISNSWLCMFITQKITASILCMTKSKGSVGTRGPTYM